ncbi:MAG: hypothetical protein M9913_20235 [Bryobacteraceae bacterium]|nr:hypothetical protein [Solibacteraceae bacterium]MCO5353181.1 hypothetical protein [Bryobacteraceae bacterium]
MNHKSPDWTKLSVFPLEQRKSLTRVEDILVDPEADAKPCPAEAAPAIESCAADVRKARERGAGVILMYGAHLLRNGSALILDRMMERRWLTHVATNGAGTIHDWEYAWLGRSTESVEQNVATGTFGAWDETGRNLHLALLAGALRGEGYGVSLGRYINEDGAEFPAPGDLERAIREEPRNPLTPARADLLQAMERHNIGAGWESVVHRWKHASILASAFRHGVPATVHPGIGYDIISNHPMFNGAVIGRAAGLDFRLFGDSVETLDGGVVLSVGSAIMAPQVFEKSLSCVNNLRLAAGRPVVKDLTIYVVDLQDSGNWDWTQGEPPKTNPAYYLRFCKSFSRMGGTMHYVQCDNLAFIQRLWKALG